MKAIFKVIRNEEINKGCATIWFIDLECKGYKNSGGHGVMGTMHLQTIYENIAKRYPTGSLHKFKFNI